MEAIMSWALRAVYLLVGLGAGFWILRWLVQTWRHAEERWPLRVAVGMLVLVVVYAVGHARMLMGKEEIEEGRMQYAEYGDPRRTELRRGEVRGWIYDCTDRPDRALATYRARGGEVERFYPLGPAGATLVGGGPDADERDYTVERLFADQLRQPLNLMESGEPHPAGTDLHLTLCSDATLQAYQLLRQTRRPGAVVVQEVSTGAVVAYASIEDPNKPPLGIQEYMAPGSVWKLALAAIWWENGLPDRPMSCQSEIPVGRSVIHNSEGFSIPRVMAPTEMLVYSCNTTAVLMAQELREQLGEQAFQDAYQRFGFLPYTDRENAPRGFQRDFWRTQSDDWARRMSPPPARAKIGPQTGQQEWAQLAIGQGPIDATPIHVSRFVQAIGNGGLMKRPTLEQAVLEDGDDEEAAGVRVMSQETSQKLIAAMLGVVDIGTARSTLPVLQGLSWDLAGKTGTAQIAGTDEDNGWFAGLIIGPDRRPRYTVVVFLHHGGPGGRMPAAVAAGMTRFFATRREPPRAAEAD